MLFHSSLRKELSRNFGATLIVLVTIVMTMMLIRTLGQAAAGSVNPAEVSMVLGFTMLGHLTTVLTMSLFIATVATLSRMYLESEMVIWFVSGRGLMALLRPLIRFAWPMLLSVFVLVLVVWPWSNQQISNLRQRFETRGDIERVAPGQFQESASGQRVFFVDKDSTDKKEGNNVFISSTENGKQSMTSAKNGRLEIIGNDQFLILKNGQRVEQAHGEAEIKVTDFTYYSTLVHKEVDTQNAPPPKALNTSQLIKNPTPPNQGELAWRLGLVFASFNFLVIALAITSANPRVGRGGNFALALFIFVVYYNFINLGQSWIASGKAPFLPLVITLHGCVFASAMTWLSIRHNNWSWRQLFKLHHAGGVA
jgi:lipopolysaccharide export system permease protein